MSAGDIFVTDADKRIAAALEGAVTTKYHDYIVTQAMERIAELEAENKILLSSDRVKELEAENAKLQGLLATTKQHLSLLRKSGRRLLEAAQTMRLSL